MSDSTAAPSATDATVASALGVGTPPAPTTAAADPAPADDTDDDDTDDAPPDDLGDAGKRALDRMALRLKTERTRRLAAEAKARELAQTDDADRMRADAEAAARAKYNARVLAAEVKAAGAGRFADPADALAFLDLSQFEVDDDGAVDGDEIRAALDDLLARKPHLAAAGGTRTPRPDRSQGATSRDAPLTTAQQFAAAIRPNL
jgi:hypothetical protein